MINNYVEEDKDNRISFNFEASTSTFCLENVVCTTSTKSVIFRIAVAPRATHPPLIVCTLMNILVLKKSSV